jgi:hypothetical protein
MALLRVYMMTPPDQLVITRLLLCQRVKTCLSRKKRMISYVLMHLSIKIRLNE